MADPTTLTAPVLLGALTNLENAQLHLLNEKAILLLLSNSSGVTVVDCRKVLLALVELENNFLVKAT